ncbi:hypothetical protein ADEAN_000848900 [Angomonas deanei]|uniref:Uncharacterized protein n=1 Tax=Angomonas deanei TaxID=59799 RepID=A0A7G2CND6_9TRYP|nr:hypothetical protein ADEAN_000848900 [Angomonas deanei]
MFIQRHMSGMPKAELQVYLKTTEAARRRWQKRIASEENQVRRLMTMEDQRREELRHTLLQSASASVRRLTRTAVIPTSGAPHAPPIGVLKAYGIDPSRVNAFSMYVLAQLCGEPDQLSIPPFTLIADLQGSWSLVPPVQKSAYEELAVIYKKHLLSKKGKQQLSVAQLFPEEKNENSPITEEPSKTSHRRKTTAKRQMKAKSKEITKRTKKEMIDHNNNNAEEVTTALTTTPSLSSTWETIAFDNFVKRNYEQMNAALSSHTTVNNKNKKQRGKKGKQNNNKNEKISYQHWLTMALAEWEGMTTRQKKLYLPK